MEPRQDEPKKTRFRLVKLEERVVPAPWAPPTVVYVWPNPGIDVANAHAGDHARVEFMQGPSYKITCTISTST